MTDPRDWLHAEELQPQPRRIDWLNVVTWCVVIPAICAGSYAALAWLVL
jgi:hypothetical protein